MVMGLTLKVYVQMTLRGSKWVASDSIDAGHRKGIKSDSLGV